MNQKAFNAAVELLQQASTPIGFTASVQEHDNYKRVWTRDGVITGLAALASEDPGLIATFRDTLRTIYSKINQYVPSNVSSDGTASYGGTAGRADNPSWAVIGLMAYTLRTGDHTLVKELMPQVNKCFDLMSAWEFNGKHLIYVPQSGDWADEYIGHGYLLFDQILRVWALKLAARVTGDSNYSTKATQIENTLRVNYSVRSTGKRYAPNLEHQLATAPDSFWLMGFNPARVYTVFDLQANALMLLICNGAEEFNRSVLEYLEQQIQQSSNLLPSFSPVINEGDWAMGELKENFAYTFRNKPHEFHNGGLWPVWNGFLSMALQKHSSVKAITITNRIHVANESGFNECLHGITGNPVGVPKCTWSAAGGILAEKPIYDLFI